MAAPKPFVIPPPATKSSGLQSAVAPVTNPKNPARVDQGVDYSQDTPYVAVGNGRIVRLSSGFAGHGQAVYYRLDKPVTINGRTYRTLYIAGPANSSALVEAGQRVVAGQALVPAGSAELGFARDDASAPAGPLIGGTGAGTQPTQAGADFYTFATGGHTPLTPQQKADAATADAQAKAASPAYVQATTDLTVAKAEAVAVAKATAHVTDPWVTVLTDKAGNPSGFGPPAFGVAPPKNVLMIGGQPATQSLLSSTWGAAYDSIWQDYTGKVATASDIVNVLGKGMSTYALRSKLASAPTFTASPIYKANAPGIAAQAKQALGANPPASFVRDAIAQGWDANTVAANLRALPQYAKGPEFQAGFAQAHAAYEGIYGAPKKEQNDWLKQHVLQGWTPDEITAKLRGDPAYKYSPEYASKAISFLDALGLYTGVRSVAAPAMPEAVAQAGKGSQLGPLPNPFQVSEGGQ